MVAGYPAEEPALADLGEVESAFRRERVSSGRAVVVSPVTEGCLRLVRSARGPRSTLLGTAELGWWIVEPIWLWLSASFVSGIGGSTRRRHERAGLQEVLEVAGASPASVVVCTTDESRAVVAPALGQALAVQDWSLRVRWSDVTRTLQLGRVAQLRIRRSSPGEGATG